MVTDSDQGTDSLPHVFGAFIGRESETAEIASLLSTARLLTLTGPGGVGKTRLAAQIATEAWDSFGHGVRWVDLGSLTDGALVPHVVATQCGVAVRSGTAVLDALVTVLRRKNMLLVLDNCEHLLPACARLIETLLTSCPELHILATSREPLSLPGEVIWLVAPLRVPEQEPLASVDDLLTYEAVKLFMARAAAVRPEFELTEENAASVVRICRRLDGLPLALELGAARLRFLSPRELAERLDDALRLLTRGSRNAPPRQQTMRATLDWSYGLLAESEQIVFCHLAVFPGSFPLDAAEKVCTEAGVAEGEGLEVLARLVDKSLVTALDSGKGTRYRLLEPLRQFAYEHLVAIEMEMCAEQQLCDWCAALAAEATANLFGPEQGLWLDRLETEHDNLRAALAWSLAHDGASIAGQIVANIWLFWQMRGYLAEGHRWIDQILEQLPEPTPLRANLLWIAGILARSNPELGQRHFNESLAIWQSLGDDVGTLRTLASQAFMAQILNDHERAVTYLEQSLLLARASSGELALADILSGLALSVLELGDLDRAELLCEEALDLCHRSGDLRVEAAAKANLGLIWQARGDMQRAAAFWDESLQLRQDIGDHGGIAHVKVLQAGLALRNEEYERATALYQESLTMRQQSGGHDGVPPIFDGLAAIASVQGDPIRAVQLAAAAEALRTTIGLPLPPSERDALDQTLATARRRLNPEDFTQAWQEGLALSPDQAYATALRLGTASSTSDSDTTPVGGSSPSAASTAPNYGLTRREIEVLRYLTFGLTYSQIAENLYISPRTVDAHVRSIFGKMDVRSRTAATRIALTDQLI
jgi:non-specific serine/threonine protein kinase